MAQNPWDAFPVASSTPAGPLPSPPPKPDKPDGPPSGYKFRPDGGLEFIPGGPADPSTKPGGTEKPSQVPATVFEKVSKDVGNFVSLNTAASSFKDDYGGNWAGGLENTAQALTPDFLGTVGTPGQREWWSAFKSTDNQIRNDLFGSALTANEKTSYEETTISPGMNPETIKANITRRADIIKAALSRQREFMIANGYKPEAVDALFAPILAKQEALADGAAAADDKAATLPAGAVPGASATPPTLSPGDPGYQAVTGDTKTVADPQTQSAVDKMLREGRPYAEVNAFAQSRGMAPMNPQEYEAVRAFIAKNPNYNGSLVNASKYEPVSTYEKAVTGLGDNAVGAYALGAGQFLSGNTLDNMVDDPERARIAMGIAEAQSPTATAVGNVSGGVMGSLLGEAGLARMGVSGGLARGLGADISTGAANGAGAADEGSRLGGALKGGVSAGIGTLAGTGVAKGVGSALNPTGGRLAELYGAGVRPSIGQRAAAAEGPISGPVGKVVNAAEEALQSVPGVGTMIRGTRQGARDQFQVGAFNQALAEIGEELPQGVKPGTDLHKTAQTAFNAAYEKARAGMTLATDEELTNELGALGPDIETLGPELQKRLKLIMDNTVNNRLDASGQMSGDAFKKVVSVLDKRIASRRKSAIADDQDFADVLEGVKTAIENAARRHSDPEAVALLDAADAGYAKLVRIEEAAARRGGDDGTFSPSQFSSAVQKGSGGVRSKAFLRGDALMQDYASAGKALDDKLPNSGTADRVMAGYAVGGPAAAGAAYFSPTAAAVLGAIGLANAPGVRKVVTGAMAPSKSRTAKAISEQLSKRARLVGRTTAAIGAAHELGTSPSQ